MGERIFQEIRKRFETDSIVMSSAATLMSHLYTMNGEMNKRKAIRKLMDQKGWNNTKRHGKASVRIDGEIYTFSAGLDYQDDGCRLDWNERKEIENILNSLCVRLEHAG